MIVAIDDAGDPGFKLNKGSSKHFIIASVFFDDDLDAEEVGLKIKRLRQQLGWPQTVEFKFRKTSGNKKIMFYEAVKSVDFKVVIAIIDKSQVTDTVLMKNPGRFYNTLILETLKASSVKLKKAHIYIDGEANGNYRKTVKAFFRQNLPENAIRQITYRDSGKDNLIQLADMVAGAALLSTKTERSDAKIYMTALKEHIEKIITAI